jgi:predicted RNA binding protein YcfA (HicA-like mRNA interferase family)
MPKLPTVSATKVIRVASKLGFELARQSGSHLILKNTDEKMLVIPNHKKLKKGTLLQIIKAMGTTKEEFIEMLR